MSIKSEDALNWIDACIYTCNVFMAGKIPLKGPVGLRARIYYRSNRSDLDVSLLMDGLQKGRVYLNDRQVVFCESYKEIDPIHPRTIVEVWEMEPLEKIPVNHKTRGVNRKKLDSGIGSRDNLPVQGEKGEIL
jgi:hypothetical protein